MTRDLILILAIIAEAILIVGGAAWLAYLTPRNKRGQS